MESLIPLVIAVPLLMAAVLVALSRVLSRRAIDVIAIVSAASATTLACLVLAHATSRSITYWFGGWLPRGGVAIGIAFVVDPFSGALAVFAGVLVTTALVLSWHYFDSIGTLYHVLMLVFLAALAGFALAGDIFTLFVFFELMSVAAFALTAYKIEEQSLQGSLNFAVTNTIAGYLLLFGLGLLYGRTGALNMAQIGETLSRQHIDGLVVVSFVLIMAGLSTKAAAVPFHFWLDDAHAVAPTPVCILFSGIMVELALYAMARIYWTVFSGSMFPYHAELRMVAVASGVLTAVLGALLCFPQRHIKRMLAFSTISHSGLIIAGLALFTSRALAGAGVYLLGHGLVKASLFICAGILLHRSSTVDELELRGVGRHMKWTATLTILGALGLCGIPPFATFLGKAWIDESAVHLVGRWLPYALSFASAFTAATVLRMAGRVFFGLGPGEQTVESTGTSGREAPETSSSHGRVPLVMLMPASLLLLGCLVLTFLPGFRSGVDSWSGVFQDRPAYARAVLHAVPETVRRDFIYPVAVSSYSQATFALVVATVVASISLYRRTFPDWLRNCWAKATGPVLFGLKHLHSGFVGDYVTWQVIGLTMLGIAVALAVR